MEVKFADADLDRLETDPRFTAGLPPEVVTMFRRRMQQVRASPDEREFRAHPSWHFELLEPKRDGVHSIRLNDKYRLVFTFEEAEGGKAIVISKVEDYHK